MNFYWLTMGALAVWRITHLLHAEDGPGALVVRLRKAAGEGLWGILLDCFYCLSLWVAAPLACWLGGSWMERTLLWPALSAAAILLERLSTPGLLSRFPDRTFEEMPDSGPALYFESLEEEDESRCRVAEE